MSRQTVLLVALASGVFVGGAVLLVHFANRGGGGAARGVAPAAPRSGQPSDPGERDFAKRLALLEEKLRGLSVPSSVDEGERTDGPEAVGGGGSLEDRIGRIEARVGEIALRLEGLEEDPVRRAYGYLASENCQIRAKGVKMLDKIARYDPQVRETLRRLLDDPSPQVRIEALQALGKAGDLDSLPHVLRLLGDADPEARWQAMEAIEDLLNNVGSDAPLTEGAAKSVAGLLSDQEATVRQKAARTLAKMKYPDAVPSLLKCLSDQSFEVREEAIHSLGRIGDTAAIPQLREFYNQGAGTSSLSSALTLWKLGDQQPFREEEKKLSQTAVAGETEDARRNAIRLLAKYSRDTSRDVFTQALNDPSPAVRQVAQEALSEKE